MFPDFEASRLLIHVAFHFGPEREQYLFQVLNAINHYGFRRVDVVLDTNSAQARNIDFPPVRNYSLSIAVHDKLEDPLALTWQHRSAMAAASDSYEYFMYLEDDMLVPYQALRRWLEDSRRLQPLGYLRAFLRTEVDPSGLLVSTDQTQPVTATQFRAAAGELWYYPENPYHAFWMYSRSQLRQFQSSPAWQHGNHEDWGIRERAAAGMTWLNTDRHHSLVPLAADGSMEAAALVQHLPNNYADNPQSEYGKLAIATLHKTGAAGVVYKAVLRLLARLSNRYRAPLKK